MKLAAPVSSAARLLAGAAVASALAGCLYGGGAGGPYSVSGTVTGVSGQGLLLSDVGGAAVFVAADGSFVLDSAFADGAAYDLDAAPDPSAAPTKCTVTRGRGTIQGASVADVAIACTPATFTVGGTLSGVTGIGLVLESRGEAITLAKDGSFVFFAPITSGSSYEVAVVAQPEGGSCAVSAGSGVVGGADVTSVRVTCTPTSLATTRATSTDDTAAESAASAEQSD